MGKMNHYEIHLTVAADSDVKKFESACYAVGTKPILLHLQLKDNSTMLDLMTSGKMYGTLEMAEEQIQRQVAGLLGYGFVVTRNKLETTPFHPIAAAIKAPKDMPKGSYFESHINVKCTDSTRWKLEEIAKAHKAHLSTNVFKRYDAEVFTIMVTLRDYQNTSEEFIRARDVILKCLDFNKFEYEKVVTEFVISDTNEQHDHRWLNA